MSIQTDVDNIVGVGSVFNLALNVAGIINNKKNVAIYTSIKGQKGVNILEGKLSAISNVVGTNYFLKNQTAIMTAEIVESSKLSEHPLEDGKVFADNKIILPTEINIQIAIQSRDYKSIIDTIRDYKNNNIMLYVETKFGVYRNMQIIAMPATLNVENISSITFSIKLREVLVSQNLSSMTADTVADVSNATTQNIGYQAGIETEEQVGVFGRA
ncbi:MAG: hypothetical protein IKB70_00285 [Bacilli bacterium]|nr:hypothetical protein [Bacilli bacterium]